jgi:maleylacetoacetate isomerase
MQPLQNLSVIKRFENKDEKQEWLDHFLTKGLTAIEKILEETAGQYCIGNSVTIADLCLVPQVYSAKRFSISLENFPIIRKVNEELEKLPEFKAAHAHNQPDTPDELRSA